MKTFFQKAKKCLAILIIIAIVSFGFYLYKLHSIAVEGNEIQGLRCSNVNPHLISWKNKYNQFMKCLSGTDPCENIDLKKLFEEHISEMKKYAAAESEWLAGEKEFSESMGFIFFEPRFVQDIAIVQMKMYEAGRDEAKIMAESWDDNDEKKTSEAIAFQKKGAEYEALYGRLQDEASRKKDWRKYFISLPAPSVCNEKNTTIPDTSNAIDPDFGI
jgi:hypothetical protein